jgi:phosphatidylserine decarboxylase
MAQNRGFQLRFALFSALAVAAFLFVVFGDTGIAHRLFWISIIAGWFLLGLVVLRNVVKEGYKFGLPPLIAGLLCLIPGWKWPAGILIFLGFFVFYFFRDPDRVIPTDPSAVVSPADGHVVEIVDELLGAQPGRRISIFLSIWDVHVQRAPVAGRIASVVYRPGKFYAALRKAASEKNEQNVIAVQTPGGTLVFKQIAGAIARRVLCWKRVDDKVALGERVGMIRFGSRVDLWLPEAAEVLVRRGQFVRGGSSVLAKWNSTI